MRTRGKRVTDEVFSYRTSRSGAVFIAWHGRTVTTLKGAAARRFLARVEPCDLESAQRVMAKATGNFKRGNERDPNARP